LEIAMEQAGEVHLLMVQVKIISIIAQFTSDGQLLNGCLNLALGKLWYYLHHKTFVFYDTSA
jgi:hypothetical protein